MSPLRPALRILDYPQLKRRPCRDNEFELLPFEACIQALGLLLAGAVTSL
jgi:hypothetical protein